jgi:signal transduction histidine kinase
VTLYLALAFSLGVHLVALVSLGLVTAEAPRLRGYRRFVGAVALWLLLALLSALGSAPAFTAPAAGAVAHFLPLVLLLGGTLPRVHVARPVALAIVAIALLSLPFTISASPFHDSRFELIYFGVAWSAAGYTVFRTMRRNAPAHDTRRWLLVTALLAAGTLSIGVLVGMGSIAIIAIVSALLASIVLYGAVRLSLFTVREDAGRTGALVADVAELDRRAVVGEIAAMVAHEVRNPLAGIRSLAQRISDDDVADERRRHYAGVIVREVDRVERMVAALLGASSGRDGATGGETDVARLFDDVALLLSARFRRAAVRLDVASLSVRLDAQREPLAQLLLNLLLNAVEQSPSVRNVTLSAVVPEGSPGVAVLTVADDGAGVPAGQRDDIWLPFRSGTGGSGLGLAVVRRLSEQHGWDARLSDTPGGGATFALTVPLVRQPDRDGAGVAPGVERAEQPGAAP